MQAAETDTADPLAGLRRMIDVAREGFASGRFVPAEGLFCHELADGRQCRCLGGAGMPDLGPGSEPADFRELAALEYGLDELTTVRAAVNGWDCGFRQADAGAGRRRVLGEPHVAAAFDLAFDFGVEMRAAHGHPDEREATRAAQA